MHKRKRKDREILAYKTASIYTKILIARIQLLLEIPGYIIIQRILQIIISKNNSNLDPESLCAWVDNEIIANRNQFSSNATQPKRILNTLPVEGGDLTVQK